MRIFGSLERCQPAIGPAAQGNLDAEAMCAREVKHARRVLHQRSADETANRIQEATGARAVADRHAQLRIVRILHQAPGHLDRLLCFRPVVEIDASERQHQRPQRPGGRAAGVGIEERQLPGRVLQPGRDLLDVLAKHLAVALVAELLLLAQHAHRERDGCQGEQQECAAEEHPQSQRHAMRPPAHQLLTQRKPRIGTFSMPSNAGSISRNASRMVLRCLRTLSRLRPLFTTW